MSTTPRSASTCFFCLCHKPAPLRRWSQGRPYTRPSTAPKPILDIKHIRDNPGLYKQNCIDRNYVQQQDNGWKILGLTRRRADSQNSAKSLREEKNLLRDRIEQLQLRINEDPAPMALRREMEQLREAAKVLKTSVAIVEEQEAGYEAKMEELALALPNLSSAHTPAGSVPEVLETVAAVSGPAPGTAGKSHVEIGAELGLLDFTAAASTTGWGWYYLDDEAALLEQALVQYAIGVCVRRGWRVTSPPSVVYAHVAAACGFQPRDQHDEQQTYHIAQADKDAAKPPLCLAATAEIPLAAKKAGRTLAEHELPLKLVAVSRCYRAEAGARGVDTKGLYRVHEFTKVEMFAWTMPDERGEGNLGVAGASHSDAVFHEMLDVQKEMLTALGLSFRVLEMPSTDLGASASRKQDIEVYFPSRLSKDNGYGEVTSASICTDYQSRRLATRVMGKGGQLDFPHTVNGTALAVPRVLAAVLEAGWDEEMKVVVLPDVLVPWMGGIKSIGRH